ncbi:MAG: hypothetical protein V1911_02620 [Candidatus Micrarchaeota archaeon]
MKKKPVFAVAVIAVIVICAAAYIYITRFNPVICGEDADCFFSLAATCGQASANFTLRNTMKMEFLVLGGSPESCHFKFKVLEFNLPDAASAESVASAEELINKEMECAWNAADVAEDNAENLHMDSCAGPLADVWKESVSLSSNPFSIAREAA